jgi:excisionase family DNA binding protein
MDINTNRKEQPMLTVIKTINGIDYTNVKETAIFLGVVQETIHRYIKEGKLSALKLSQRKFYIPVSDVMKLINQ